MASSGAASGSSPTVTYKAGYSYCAPGLVDTQVMVQTDFSVMPFPVYGAHTFTGIGCWVTTAATGTTVNIRLGAYRDNAGYPGSLIVDAGTIDATSTGEKTITGLSISASNEILWLAAIQEGTNITGNASVVGANSLYAFSSFGVPTVIGSNPFIGASWTAVGTAITGALPSTFPAGAVADEGSWAVFLIG